MSNRRSIFFLDCEFNGFGGELISMGMVSNCGNHLFYEVIEQEEETDPWVAKNVLPLINPSEFVSYSKFQMRMCGFLLKHSPKQEIEIIADWPDDIRYFMEALITGPGEMLPIRQRIITKVDRSLSSAGSRQPHHALYDAMAIRESFWHGS